MDHAVALAVGHAVTLAVALVVQAFQAVLALGWDITQCQAQMECLVCRDPVALVDLEGLVV